MRPRFVVLASLLAALPALAVPALGSAAPRHNRGLTINAAPNPILAGDPVLVYGQLNNPPVAGDKIILYHRVADSKRGYTRVSQTTTDVHGFFSFPRDEQLVMTNRSWFVREAGTHGVHSRTVYERVAALVSLAASTTTQDTDHPIVFTGHVTPNHAFQRVALQVQRDGSDDWRTLKTGFIGPGSDYAISYRWRIPGSRDVRVVLPGDARNIRSASDPVTVTIQQAQVAGFTINTSSPIVDSGNPVTISGADQAAPNSQVTLYERTLGHSRFVPVAFAPTGSDGAYAFTQSPVEDTRYQVRTTGTPHGHSAVLFQGARDVITMSASSTNPAVGQRITFDGTVLPDKAGHVVYLQRLGRDGDWHVVEVRFVRNSSTFQFGWRFGHTGTETFRARITSDRRNIGAASDPLAVTASQAPTASLAPAS